jgi:hypothetical protein
MVTRNRSGIRYLRSRTYDLHPIHYSAEYSLHFTSTQVLVVMNVQVPHSHIVIDVNCLRDDTKIEKATAECRQHNLTLLVPDGVGYEVGKVICNAGEQLRKSLAHFAPCLDVLKFSRKLESMRKSECEIRQVTDSLVNEELSRDYIAMIKSGTGWDQIQASIHSLMPSSVEIWSDTSNLNRILKLADLIIESPLNDASTIGLLSKKLRNNSAAIREEACIELLCSPAGIEFVRYYFLMQGFNNIETDSFLRAPSLTVAYVVALASLAIRFKFMGLPKAADTENSFHDIEYATYAAISGSRLVTKDEGLMSMMRIVSAVRDSFSNQVATLHADA